MQDLLIDTHILVWWRTEPRRLSRQQRRVLDDLEAQTGVARISAITLWELAKMVERGRLQIDSPLDLWLAEIEAHPLLSVVPIDARIAAESVNLGADFHRDPADQIIVATARCKALTLVTADERIRRWGKVLIV
jgi:PIN domain nuclease of toxin-antitoxin system